MSTIYWRKCAYVAAAVFFCSLTFAQNVSGSGDGTNVARNVETAVAAETGADADVPEQQRGSAATPGTPEPAQIRVYLMLNPQLTRGLQMGDQWASPPTFTNVRQAGRSGSLQAKAVGLDAHGRLMYPRLEVEWKPADPDMVTVSPVTGSEVTITMKSPGRSTLRVVHGEISELLTFEATYDDQIDRTQLVISQGSSE